MDSQTVERLAECFKTNKKYWNELMTCITCDGILSESKMEGIPDDVWTMAKRCISLSDETLIKWFNSEIPAFFGGKPVDIIKFTDGIDALRQLMMSLPG